MRSTDRHDDPLNPARGILIAFAIDFFVIAVLGTMMWVAMGSGSERSSQINQRNAENFIAAPRTANGGLAR